MEIKHADIAYDAAVYQNQGSASGLHFILQAW
jgi:hypothetical protein